MGKVVASYKGKNFHSWEEVAKRFKVLNPSNYRDGHDNTGIQLLAFKYVTKDFKSPMHTSTQPVLDYTPGKVVHVGNANTDYTADCAAGVNVATAAWCLKDWSNNYSSGVHTKYTVRRLRGCTDLDRRFTLIALVFRADEVTSVPRFSRGKFRTFHATVLCEIPSDAALKKLGAL